MPEPVLIVTERLAGEVDRRWCLTRRYSNGEVRRVWCYHVESVLVILANWKGVVKVRVRVNA